MSAEIIQQLDYTSYDIKIMAITIVFVKSQYILLIDGSILVDTEFANIYKLV